MTVPARLAAYYFAYFAQAGALIPYFSLYLAARGFGAAEIAFVLAMPQAARLFAPAFWGWLADTWEARCRYAGARRAIVVFSGLAALAGFLALYAVRDPSGVAMVMLALSAMSAGALPLVEAITLASLQGRAGQYGPIRLWGSIGFILAVLGAGAWLDRRDASSVLEIVLVLTVAVCAAALAIPSLRIRHDDAGERVSFGAVLRRGDVLAFLASGMCMAAAHGTLYAFYSIYLEAAGYSKALIGALWTLGVVAEVALFLRLPQLMARFSLRALLVASFACAVVRFLAIGWGIEWLAVLAVAQLLHAATFGAFHAASVAAVHRLFPGGISARGQAIYSSLTYGVGGSAGTLIAGWTWESLGPAPSFALSAFFGALGALLVAWKVRV